MASGQTLWDQLIEGVGESITDIRQKLIEEPWYGRTLEVVKSELAVLRPIGSEQGHDTPSPALSQGQPIDR